MCRLSLFVDRLDGREEEGKEKKENGRLAFPTTSRHGETPEPGGAVYFPSPIGSAKIGRGGKKQRKKEKKKPTTRPSRYFAASKGEKEKRADKKRKRGGAISVALVPTN